MRHIDISLRRAISQANQGKTVKCPITQPSKEKFRLIRTLRCPSEGFLSEVPEDLEAFVSLLQSSENKI